MTGGGVLPGGSDGPCRAPWRRARTSAPPAIFTLVGPTMLHDLHSRPGGGLPSEEHASLTALRHLAETAHTELVRSFVHHMIRIHPGHRPPSRSEFDPIDVPRLLPSLVMAKVLRNPLGFELTVVGHEVRQAIGRPMMGKRLEALAGIKDPQSSAPLADRIKAVEARLPIHRFGEPRILFKVDFARVEVCHMPLVGMDGDVSHVLSAIAYEGRGQFGSASQ